MQTWLQYGEQRKQAELIKDRNIQRGGIVRQESDLYLSVIPGAFDAADSQLETSPSSDEQPTTPPSPPQKDDDSEKGVDLDGAKQKIHVKCEDDGKDQADPRNWSQAKKYWTTTILFVLVFSQGWVSACDTAVTKKDSAKFHVSRTAEDVSTAMFLLGISAGSLVAGPLSEELGRNPVYLVPSIFYLCFTLGDALAPNYAAQIVFRFLAGLCASPTLSIYGGSLADIFETHERQKLWPIFALSPLLSPVLSPVAGGWIAEYASWRWVYWAGLALSLATFLLAFFFLPETSSPMIIQWRTHHLRQITGNGNYTCQMEVGEGLGKRLAQNLTRPAKFFTTEPIIIALGLYLIVVYIVIFTFLNGFEFVFTDTYGLSSGIASLAFLGICLGALISTILGPLINKLYKRLSSSKKDGSKSDTPEALLVPAIVASPFFAISVFWLGWTNFKSISYWSAHASTVLFGYSMAAIFVYSYSYIIHIYGTWSSSALGSVTMARYLFAAGMLVAARPMYQGIGVHWSSTFLGGLGVICLPVPFLLYTFGVKLRKKSQFIEVDDEEAGEKE
jgi:DHA1 family multidrug resistance protein-like MFS transporter